SAATSSRENWFRSRPGGSAMRGGNVTSIVVRPDGEAGIVARRPDSSLQYYRAVPGASWRAEQVAGPGTTVSEPSVVLRPDGEAGVLARGPGNTLMCYWAVPGASWRAEQVAGPGT